MKNRTILFIPSAFIGMIVGIIAFFLIKRSDHHTAAYAVLALNVMAWLTAAWYIDELEKLRHLAARRENSKDEK